MSLVGLTNAEKIWNFIKSKGLNDYSTAGILGNMDAESGLNPQNLQDSCQSKLGMNDATYTNAVDTGIYSKEQFIYDNCGYSICQWTHSSRKKAFYEFTKSNRRSIGDLENALEFFYKELSESFPGVLQSLKAATSVREASNIILLKYECPADQSLSMQNKRANMAQAYYSRFASGQTKEVESIMGYKYFTKGQAVKVSAHFYSTEFDCHGSGCCTQTIVNEKLIEYLEKIREHFNAPITITSPYRCPIHNSRPSVGGAPSSRHTKGDAADIVVKGVAPRTVAQYAESIGILGIGLYETSSDGHFVHIDTRDYRSFWYGQSEQPRTTFGAYTGATTNSGVVSSGGNSSGTSVLDTILNRGDFGIAVKKLQEKLIKLGYSCGECGADGDFGKDTEDAVCEFQRDSSIGVDGIAGSQTLAYLDKAIAALNATVTSGNSVKVTASALNVRSGAGTNYPAVSYVRNGSICTVVEEKNGWGRIVSPAGWISMEYVEKV